MTKPARAKLSIRTKAPVETAIVETVVETIAPTCYALNGTEVIFSPTAALICHEGAPGQTQADIAANVDALFFMGAFAELRGTGVFMKKDGVDLDQPSASYSLIVDAALMATIDAQRLALEDAAGTFLPQSEPVASTSVETVVADEPAFEQDAVFQQTPVEAAAQVEAPSETVAAERPPLETEAFELDLTVADITFKTTTQGLPCAAIRMPGMRTHMAFGELADYVRGASSVTGTIQKGRSTNKIVAIQVPGSNDVLVETPRAA